MSIVVFDEYQDAIKSITTNSVTFVSGSAGSGKSTFIHYICNLVKNTMLLAPTGLAAVNIGGRTIHSVFKFPPTFLTESDIRRMKSEMCNYLRSTNLIIIDEVSMVSSNLLDAVDSTLRLSMGVDAPFGGIPLLIVGDLCQLAPIVGNDRVVIEAYMELYDSEYFFDSNVMHEIIEKNDFKLIMLKKVMRQKDDAFVKILSAIRTDKKSNVAIDILNKVCRFEHVSPDEYVQITPYNEISNNTNNRKLMAIDSELKTYYGMVEGAFNKNNFPVDQTLKLKVGAQIMVCKNLSPTIVNGSIGVVKSMESNYIIVDLFDGQTNVKIEPAKWDEFGLTKSYSNDGRGQYTNGITGTYKQLPIKLAWSMTIHKCQGATIENLYIDMSKGAFATGMLYVALSRATNLKTLVLSKPLQYEDVLVDDRVLEFYNKFGFGV